MENEPVPFHAGERHEEQIGDIHRVLDPVPCGAECMRGGIDRGGVHVRFGERQWNGDEQKRDDEQKKDNMMVKRLTKLPLGIEFVEDEDETGKRKKLQSE